jgi:hypothetical protein
MLRVQVPTFTSNVVGKSRKGFYFDDFDLRRHLSSVRDEQSIERFEKARVFFRLVPDRSRALAKCAAISAPLPGLFPGCDEPVLWVGATHSGSALYACQAGTASAVKAALFAQYTCCHCALAIDSRAAA